MLKRLFIVGLSIVLLLSSVSCEVAQTSNETSSVESELPVLQTQQPLQESMTEEEIVEIVKNEIKEQTKSLNDRIDELENIPQQESITQAQILEIVKNEIAKEKKNANSIFDNGTTQVITTNSISEKRIREIVKEELSKVSEPEEIEFIEGKELTCLQGESFKLKGIAELYQTYPEDKYEMNFIELEITSIRATMFKKLDKDNIEHYRLSGNTVYHNFLPYMYKIELSGKADPKFHNYNINFVITIADENTVYERAVEGYSILDENGRLSFTFTCLSHKASNTISFRGIAAHRMPHTVYPVE